MKSKSTGPLAALKRLASRVIRRVDQQQPRLNVELQAELEAILQAPGPLLILHLHEGHLLLSAELVKRRIGFVRIANNPERHHAKLSRAGIDSRYVHMTRNDVVSLVALRELSKRHRIICCAIDYKNEGGERHYINPSIIGFANRFQIPVAFVTAVRIDDDRSKLVCCGPYKNAEPVACAQSFVEFFNSVTNEKRPLQVKRYSENPGWRKRNKERGRKPGRLSRFALTNLLAQLTKSHVWFYAVCIYLNLEALLG